MVPTTNEVIATATATYSKALALVRALEALGRTSVAATVAQLREELVQASQQHLNDHEKIVSLERELHNAQQQLEQRDVEVAALQHALALATATATAPATENGQQANGHVMRRRDLASATPRPSTRSKTATSRAPRGTAAPSVPTRPAWNSSTRTQIDQASRPATAETRARARVSTTARAVATAAAARGDAVPVRPTATVTVTAAAPRPQKQTTKPTQPKTRIGQQLHWTVMECVREQEQASYSLALILQDLQEITEWRVDFKTNVLWILRGDDASPSPLTSASIIRALIAHAKRLDKLKRNCDGKIKAVSHRSPDRKWLHERHEKLVEAIPHVRAWVVDLITTLRQTSASESARQEEDGCVSMWREHVAPKLTEEIVRQLAAERATVEVSTPALQSVALAMRGFHVECLGAWAASLSVDATSTIDVDLMEYGASVLGEITARTEQLAETTSQWLDAAAVATKVADAVAKVDAKLLVFSSAVARYDEGGYDFDDSDTESTFGPSDSDTDSAFEPSSLDTESPFEPGAELAYLELLYLCEDLMGENASEVEVDEISV